VDVKSSNGIRAEEAKTLLLEVAKLREENAALRSRVAELTDLSDSDPLLKILNRRAFLREMRRLQAYCARHGLAASLVFFDLDDLAGVNNRHGHAAGDEALRHVCEAVAGQVRGSDILGRLGGDEFGLLLVGADPTAAREKMDELSRRISGQAVQAGLSQEGFKVSITYGVEALDGESAPENILSRADQDFYGRKAAGRKLRNSLTQP
jgi:diguanylate cyclase (GGDEF)-like protein